MSVENGEARTIGVPLANAGAEAHAPNQADEPPEYTVVLWNDLPVLYQRVKER